MEHRIALIVRVWSRAYAGKQVNVMVDHMDRGDLAHKLANDLNWRNCITSDAPATAVLFEKVKTK